jgi:hypothetical protein
MSFPDYKHLLQENYVENKYCFNILVFLNVKMSVFWSETKCVIWIIKKEYKHIYFFQNVTQLKQIFHN